MEEQLAMFESVTRWHAVIRRTGYTDCWDLVLNPIGGGRGKSYRALTWRELGDVLELELGVFDGPLA